MKFVQPKRGYIKFKVQCPACGRMAKGHIKLDEHKTRIVCECGRAELSALFYRSLEWEVESEVEAQSA